MSQGNIFQVSQPPAWQWKSPDLGKATVTTISSTSLLSPQKRQFWRLSISLLWLQCAFSCGYLISKEVFCLGLSRHFSMGFHLIKLVDHVKIPKNCSFSFAYSNLLLPLQTRTCCVLVLTLLWCSPAAAVDGMPHLIPQRPVWSIVVIVRVFILILLMCWSPTLFLIVSPSILPSTSCVPTYQSKWPYNLGPWHHSCWATHIVSPATGAASFMDQPRPGARHQKTWSFVKKEWRIAE